MQIHTKTPHHFAFIVGYSSQQTERERTQWFVRKREKYVVGRWRTADPDRRLTVVVDRFVHTYTKHVLSELYVNVRDILAQKLCRMI